MARIEVSSAKPGVPSAWVEIACLSDEQLLAVCDDAKRRIAESGAAPKVQISTAVAEAFQSTMSVCPQANPSDIWHHVIYRQMLRLGYSDAQWKRISGFALERALAAIYNPRLQPLGIRMRIVGKTETIDILKRLGLSKKVPISKVDLFIEGNKGSEWIVFGVAHAKSSVAERIQDDVPASVPFMKKGFLSIMLTMDAKSYPPPHGSGENFGELGGRSFDIEKQRLKRDYVEKSGQFDALFSFNLRTPPSPARTPSAKKIYTLSLTEPQPDQLVAFLQKH